MTAAERARVLDELVSLDRPLDGALAAVRGHPWDSEVELVVVRPTDVHSVLVRFLRHEFTAEDGERWADALESRDDVAMDPQLPPDLLYELATQDTEGPLTLTRAAEVIRELDSAGD